MRNVEIVRCLYDAFNRGDVSWALGAMHPNIEWHEAEGNPYEPSGKAWIGPDAVMQKLFVKIAADWDFFRVHPKEFHDAGNTVVVELRYEAKHKATGKGLDAQVCHVIQVRDGKIVKFQQFVDTAQLQDVMGAY